MLRPVLLALLCLCLTVHTAGALWAQAAFPAQATQADTAADTTDNADLHACCPDDATPQPLTPDCHETASCCMHANPLLTAPATPALARLAHSVELPSWQFSHNCARCLPHTRPPIGG